MNKDYKNDVIQNASVEKDENFKFMFEAFNVPMVIISLNGQIQKANKAFCVLTGYDENAVLKMNISNFSPKEEFENNFSVLKQLISGKIKSVNIEKRIFKSDGKIIWTKISAVLLKDTFGNAKYVGAILEDITQIKKAEKQLIESELQYRRFFDEDLTGDFISSPDGKILVCNQAFVDLLKCKSIDAVLKINAHDLYWKPGNREEFLKRLKKEKKITNIELDLKGCDGSKISVIENVLGVFNDEGELIQIVGFIFDITIRKEMESALRESEQKFRSVFENSPLGKSMTTLDGKLHINQAFCNILGYTYEELNNINWEEITHPEDIEKSSSYVKALLEGEIDSASFEKRYIHKNKKIVWTEVNTTLLKDNSNNPLFFITSMNDITERKNNEAALLESEKKYRKIFENVQDVFFITDINGILTDISPSIERHTEYTLNELIGKHVGQYYYNNEDRLKYLNMFKQFGEVNDFETQMVTKTGRIVYVSMNAHYRYDNDGNMIGIEGSLRDITERKKIEKSLKQSEAKYREVVEQAVENIFTTDNQGYFTYANPAALKLSGYSMEELSKLKFSDLVIPEYQRLVAITYFRQFLEKTPVTYTEYPFKTKSGDIKWFGQNARLIIDNDHVKGFYVIARDITERRHVEEKLEKKTKELDLFFSNSLDLLCIANTEGYFLRLNPEWENTLGYKLDELEGKQFINFVHPNDVESTLDAVKTLSEQKEVTSFVNRYLHKDGSFRWIEWKSYPSGKTIYAAARDITERKKNEIALQENERRLKTLFSNLPGMAYRCLNDKKWTTEFISEGCKKLTGYSSHQLVGNKSISYNDIIYPEDRELVWNEVQTAVKNNKPIEIVYRIITSENEIKWVLEKGNGIYNETGTLIALEGFISDITERVKFESALKDSEEKFRSIFENSPVGKSLTTLDGKFYVNQAFAGILGYSKEELSKMNWEKITYPDDILKSKQMVDSLLNREIDKVHFEKRYIHKTGSIVWVDMHVSLQRNQEGNPLFFITSALDITEKKKYDEELFTSRQMLKLILDNVPQRIFWKDKNYKYMGCNKPFAADAGLNDTNEVIGKDDFEMSWKDIAHHYRADDKIVMDTNTPKLNFEEPQTHFSGAVTWLRTNKVPLHDKHGNVVGVIGTYEDITLAKKAEEQILLLSRAVEKSPASIMITDEAGNIEYVNQKFMDLTGYSLEEIKGKNPRILKSGMTSNEDYKELWKTIKSGKEWRGEFQNKKKNGELYWESATIAPIKNGKTFFLAIKEDITDKKISATLLKESEERFEQVTSSADEWVWEVDAKGLYTYSSKAVENILGYSPKEIVGKKYFYDLFDPEIREEIKEEAFSIMNRKDIIRNMTNLNLHKNGSKVYLETNGFPIIDSKGNVTGYRGADKDITERRKIQKELITAKEKAEQSDKLKTEFLAQMSHEIRTPINIITNNVDFIKEELGNQVGADNEELFDSVTLSSRRIIRTIDLILNMSEIKTGLYNPLYVNIDLHSEVLEKLFNEHRLFAKNKNIELRYSCKSSNTKIKADEYSVNQIFANLIDNALKYTKQGKVEILFDNNLMKEIFVQIKDTGIGMSKEFQLKMFDAFVQEEQGYSRSYDGNGLGLALTKKYCELNNININVESEKGKGTIFTLTFPK
ncbi:MAG: PAS domain S-box protein [Melioribacter sp.]|nr:PAS domain S-box protein [Melioribacter sp.]